jgi:glycosyltransferase involved in cell wall biosynthesis
VLSGGRAGALRILVTMPWGQRLGGAEAMLQAVLEGAPDSGHELELLFFEDGPWPQELRDAGFRVEIVPSGRLREPHRWARSVLALARIFRQRQPDLILNWSAKTHLYGSPAAVLAGMGDRVIWWQQSIPIRSWLDSVATLLPALAVGCYSEAAARAQRRLFPTRRTFVVAAGAPQPGAPQAGVEAQASAALPPLPAGRVVVGLVGRLQPWKGQDRMLRAQALLRERGHDIHLLIVGGDAYGLSADYAASLPRLVAELGLEDAVTMTDHVPDAGPYIEQMEVLVNASDPEPFGIVLLEGMARGVAVLAVDSGGPAEFIEQGVTGSLAGSGEPVDLADALEPLLGSPALRRRIGAAGREAYLRDFTDVAMRERFFGRLEGLLADRPRSAPCEVTIVAHDLGSVGGMERQLAELVLGLARLGHRVTVIARTCVLPPDSGVVFHRVRGPGRPFLIAYPWFLLAGSLAVWRWRRGVVQATGAIVLNRVDAIAIHCCHQAYTAMPGRPTPLFRCYGKAVGVLKRVGERWCVRRNGAARLVCVSEGVAAEMREYYPEAGERVLSIHNGVDTGAFAPGVRGAEARALRERLAIAPERLLAAFVGGDWEHKGLRLAIEALGEAQEWDLLVAGRGHQESYRALADSIGVAERVHWLGVVEDIQVVYELADAFVLPSSYETFSLVTFEAAASGLPILATAVNGVRELIEDSENGFLIERTPRDIAEHLTRLAADPRLRERLGDAARHSALRFGWERMVAAHDALFEALADPSGE